MGVTKKDQAGEPKPMVINADGRRKVHRTYPDGSELVEEYDQKTDVLLLRKSRKPGVLGKEGQWVIEVGQVAEKFDRHTGLLAASDTQPVFMRKDTKAEFQWRIRNLPYAKDIYDIRVDFEKNEIVVRTTNKKYFKRIDIPDLKRAYYFLPMNFLFFRRKNVKKIHSNFIIFNEFFVEKISGN